MYVFLSLGFGIRPFTSSQSIDIHVSAKQLGILKCFNCTKKLSRTTRLTSKYRWEEDKCWHADPS